MIRISIVEDDEGARIALAEGLGLTGKVEVVGMYRDAESYLAAAGSTSVDVVMMDIQLPRKNGISAISEVKPRHPEIQFMMWTAFEEHQLIFDALCAGATGYLLKKSSLDQIVTALEELVQGGSPMSGSVARKVIQAFQKPSPSPAADMLTRRELEILEQLDKGSRYKDIAVTLNISVDTVRTHIRSIYEKLHVQSRTQAVNRVFPR